MFPYKHIDEAEIENMLYMIAAYSDKRQAKRFNDLSFEKRQKVTVILKMRQKRAGKSGMNIDAFTIREVLDDANKTENGIFIFKDKVYE